MALRSEVTVSFNWYVYSTLSKKQALAVEDRLNEALERLFEAQPALAGKRVEDWGELTVEEAVPSADDAAELGEAYGRSVSEEVLDRLDACRTAFAVERHGVNELDALQVSVLRFLIDAVGPCVVDWGDLQIVLSEDVLEELDEYADAGELGSGGAPRAPRPAKAEAETSEEASVGLGRSEETEAALEKIASDPFISKRLVRALAGYPDFVQAYVEALRRKGPVSDAAAAKAHGVSVDDLEPELVRFHRFVLELADEIEDDEESDEESDEFDAS